MRKIIIIIGLVIIGIAAFLYIIGKKSVHSEILINASADKVWQVLTDTDKYSEWNPTMKLLEGKMKVGNTLKYEFTQDEDNKSEIPVMVKQIIPNELLNQGGGIPMVLTYNHRYVLEPTDNGTKVIIQEDYKGIYVPFWNPKPVELAYQKLNKALKKKVEQY
jgi:hypothetical protein